MKSKYLEIKPEDLAKIEARREKELKARISPEWKLVGEFGMLYGWGAIEAVFNNTVDSDVMNTLIIAGRKVEAQRVIDNALAEFAVLVAKDSGKKSDTVLRSGLKPFYDEVK